MDYLILGITGNALIFIAFRSFALFRIDNLQAIVVNYVVSVITGILFTGKYGMFLEADYAGSWKWYALALGIFLVLGFYAASYNTQLIGVSVTSVASKMSMVIPILVSLFFLKIDTRQFTMLNYAGMALAVLSIYLGSVKKETRGKKSGSRWLILLPFAVFLAGGAIDTLINYSNYAVLTPRNADTFPIFVFAAAGIIGIIYLLIKRERLAIRNIIGGIYLGIPNFFALYFGFKALAAFDNDGAVFFPIYNVGTIILTTLFAIVLFGEKLSKINILGLFLSFAALFLLSYQELITYLFK